MKILIIGGGIGGCSTALALQHFGFESDVFEAADEIKEVGAGVWVAPNAMKVYDKIGIAKEIQDAGMSYEGFLGIGTNKGDILSKINCHDIFKAFGYYTTAIHRAKLLDILVKHTPHIQTKKKLVSYQQYPDKVVATFEDGTQSEGDLLIGADGIKSKTREQMFGPTPFRYSGQTCWRLVAPYTLESKQQNMMMEMWGEEAGKRAAYGSLGHGQTYMYLTIKAEKEGKDHADTLKSDLQSMFSSFPSIVHELIEITPSQQILRNDLYDFAPIPCWYDGRVALVGDSAHATTPNLGQGACQAIESAFVVSKCLTDSKNHEDAWKAYQALRIKKAHFVTNTSWRMGQITNFKAGWLRSLRNIAVKYTPKSTLEILHQRLYSFPH